MVATQLGQGSPLSPDLAEQLVTQSINAASQPLAQGARLDKIIDRVAVPGGNTAAAIEAGSHDLTTAWRTDFGATADNERGKPLPAL
ncbi:pyrroline-5-carboxylate reductase dimerization domain-containing protein [Nocardia sp. NPDC060256]|uniref:pyrroline-5-carboxylate reductase dimerization domain-containing protein n=1 Tax=unclassified Nocardia TaxID=2637762 RepID=UPI00365B454C